MEVVDRLEAEALKGLWAVPKRGAEVGGVLLGTGTPGGGMVVEDSESATGDVSFRLELQHASTVLSQSLRVLSPGSPTPESALGLPRRSSHSRSR